MPDVIKANNDKESFLDQFGSLAVVSLLAITGHCFR
jgi:hypothetical protein